MSSALAAGGTPWPGLVIGARLAAASLDPRFVEAGRDVTPDDDSVKLTLLQLGPFVDYYPNPRRGFHTLLDAGLVFQIEHDTKGKPIEPAASGLSATTQTGYEWFVSSELSLGFLVGVSFGYLGRTTKAFSEHMRFAMPLASLTATYH